VFASAARNAAFAISIMMSAASPAQQPPAGADENLTLRDHHFKLSPPVPSGLLCAMTEDEGRHFDLGMIYRFTIE
jgi:hypothetical protein